MTLPLFEPTWSVSALCGEIREVLGEAFAGVWVAGEVQRARPSARGHFYFELIEKGAGDEITGKLDAVIWKTDYARVQKLLHASGQAISDGLAIRCHGGLDFYGAGGRLQLVVKNVDPTFSLGHLERRRRETLAALEASGLLVANRSHSLSELPLSIALITSEGSAAYHDFLSGLRASGYGFRVLLFHVSVQGQNAEREITSALKSLDGLDLDAAVLIRGGGARSDLAVFDSRAVAEALARVPFPVLTGLGHETDQSIADLAAHTALKTPTQVAEFLIERVATCEHEFGVLTRRLRREALEPLRRGREALGRAERGLALGKMRLAETGRHVDELARALARRGRGALKDTERRRLALEIALATAAPERLAAAERQRQTRGERLVASARAQLREAAAHLSGQERLIASLGPERTLERGFSITRDARGRIVRDAQTLAPGAELSTRLARGAVTARVERIETADPHLAQTSET